MAISKIRVNGTEHELETTIANVSGLQDVLDNKANDSDKADSVKTASGEAVSLNNSVHTPLYGFKLYGKTTQNGTPTPETPVEMVNAGDDGSVGVSVLGKNIMDIYGFTTTSLNTPDAERNLSNNYGTTISTINPTEKLTVNQTTYTGSTLGDYRNGYFIIAFMYKLYKGQRVSFSFDLEITNNPLNTADFLVMPNGIAGQHIQSIGGNRWGGVLEWDEYQERNYIEVRNAGISGIFSNFQIEFAESSTAYEPYKSSQTLAVSTSNGLAGIPVTSGGNYTDSNGQQWICDEVDFARGVYVQRVGRINSYAGEEVATAYISSTGELSDGAAVLYALATPIETPLSTEQLEAYAPLHTNEPNTTIMNDGNAGMEVKYYTPSTAVQMVHSPSDEGKILSIDEHGCVVLSELDAGSIDINLDGANNGEINSINADTLGGVPANNYVLKDELEDLIPDGSNNSSVLYTQQDLTEAQQAQVRENIGIDIYITACIEEALLGGEW